MSELQALIFDVDGTLADTERDGHRVAFNLAFKAAGLDWDWSIDLYPTLLNIGGGKERIKFYLDQNLSQFQAPGTLTEFITVLHHLKTQFYQELLLQGKIPLRCGVHRLLTQARQENIRLAIATTSQLPGVLALLENNQIPCHWFEVIAAGDCVPHKKPAPDVYHYVLDQMHLTSEHCLVFEDSPTGFWAAQAAGLKTVVTVNSFANTENFLGALLVVDHLGEPDAPFTVITGTAGTSHYFDMDCARFLLTEALAPPG